MSVPKAPVSASTPQQPSKISKTSKGSKGSNRNNPTPSTRTAQGQQIASSSARYAGTASGSRGIFITHNS